MTIQDLLREEFHTIAHASRKLGLSRHTIYRMINTNEISDIIKDRIKGRGYCPETLKPIAHADKA